MKLPEPCEGLAVGSMVMPELKVYTACALIRITPVSTGSWRSYPLRVKSGVPEAFKTQKSEPTSQL